MVNIRAIEMLFLDDLFQMGGGYVLKFSDRTFAQFFDEELQINIDDTRYSKNGTSKAKRLQGEYAPFQKYSAMKELDRKLNTHA